MRTVKIIHKKNAMHMIPEIVDKGQLCYYLTDDYSFFIDLRDTFSDRIKVHNLSGILEQTFQEIKGPFLELISGLNKENDSLQWWAGQIASRNLESTPLLLNITYLFCAKKILFDSDKDILFIVNSKVLSDCITRVAGDAGLRVVTHGIRMNAFIEAVKRRAYIFIQLFYYILKIIESRRVAFRRLKPLPPKKINIKKRIVLRSWITQGTFNEVGKFQDRNFGRLPAWLRARDYEVWHLPMFFNLSISLKQVYSFMENLDEMFLIPDHYITFTDYAGVLCNSFQMLRKRFVNITLNNINVAPFFDDAIKRQGLDPALMILNLSVPMLKRLKEKGFEIDGFYYAFEGNAPEKPFVLGCKKYFPDSVVVGFQHTTFYANQLTYHLGPGEKDCHPLPDKLVCSGPIYIELHKKAGFPPEILCRGANLRYGSVYMKNNGNGRSLSRRHKNIILPLTFSHDLAFELLVKVRDALWNREDYKIYIRTHPLLTKNKLVGFLEKAGFQRYEFADDGIYQDWLPEMFAVISSGGSITVVESVAMGIPVIRVVPDNNFFHDPFFWQDYPFEPVNTSLEIRDQLQLVETFLDDDSNVFRNIGKQVLLEYYTEPNEENLKVFL